MAVKPAPLKASAAPKAVAKIPAKIASPSKVVNQTAKTVTTAKDDAGTMKLAPKSTVVAKPSANAPLKAGSAPKAAPKPVQTSNIPASVKPTDLTTKIQQNLNKPQMQPIGSNAPMNLYQDRGAIAAAELAKAQAASAAQQAAQQKLLAQREAEKLAQQQATLKAQAQQAAQAPKPVVQPAPVIQQPAPAPQPIVQPPVQTPVVQQPVAPTPAPTPAPVITPPAGYSLTKPVVNPTPTPPAVISTNPVITPVSGDKPAIPTTVTPVTPQLPNYTPTPVVTPPAMDYSQYKLPTGWGFSKTPAVATPKV